tara:strand:+ start:148 stop:1095 length:948 start_codon:yes stop_codon:yes gene_type:complete
MSFIETPTFASKFNYLWHSNPRSKLKCKTLFDKVHLRPIISDAWEIYGNINNEDSIRGKAWAILEKYDSKFNGQDNSAMCGGRTVQEATDKILIDNEDPVKAIDKSRESFNNFKPRTWDDGSDAEKKVKYIDEFEAVTKNAVAGLREAMTKDNQIIGEIEYIEKLPGLELPHNTRPDYNRRGDLKTKWSRLSKTSKSGFAAASLPKTLSGPFEQAALYQVAGFWACNGGLPPFLVYANASDYRIFDQDNTPELQDDNLQDIVNTIIRSHKATEELLKVAKDKAHLFKLVEPNFSHICWSEPPVIIEEAKKLWGIK